jgi:hypothetical protein
MGEVPEGMRVGFWLGRRVILDGAGWGCLGDLAGIWQLIVNGSGRSWILVQVFYFRRLGEF